MRNSISLRLTHATGARASALRPDYKSVIFLSGSPRRCTYTLGLLLDFDHTPPFVRLIESTDVWCACACYWPGSSCWLSPSKGWPRHHGHGAGVAALQARCRALIADGAAIEARLDARAGLLLKHVILLWWLAWGKPWLLSFRAGARSLPNSSVQPLSTTPWRAMWHASHGR